MKKIITAKEAINLLPEKDEIHTFYNYPFGLIGGDWNRADVLQKLIESDKIELTGEIARNMGHGLAVYNDNSELQSEVLFVETDKKKLDEFDPQPTKE